MFADTSESRPACASIALAGGVALNCTANGKLIDSGIFDEVYIQPAAGDDGTALGAALYRASLAEEVHNERMPVPLLGPAYPSPLVDEALFEKYASRITVTLSSLSTRPAASRQV